MRKMKNKSYGSVVNVVSFAMTKGNMWEYFITDQKFSDDIVCAVVVGFECEMGDISLSEIKPHLMFNKDIMAPENKHIMPAPGWEWV